MNCCFRGIFRKYMIRLLRKLGHSQTPRWNAVPASKMVFRRAVHEVHRQPSCLQRDPIPASEELPIVHMLHDELHRPQRRAAGPVVPALRKFCVRMHSILPSVTSPWMPMGALQLFVARRGQNAAVADGNRFQLTRATANLNAHTARRPRPKVPEVWERFLPPTILSISFQRYHLRTWGWNKALHNQPKQS